MTKRKASTIRDVADAVGVSTATISKYMNGLQRFSPTVEARINKAIEDLSYRSNPVAQAMITGKTKAIGLSILDISNPHFTSLVKGANRIALAHGYTLLLVDTEENLENERRLIEALSRRVDGLLIFSRLPEDELIWLSGLDKPWVFFGRLAQANLLSVSSDDRRGAYMLAQHLVTLGHRKMAYLGFPRSRRDEERIVGIEDCLQESGLTLRRWDVNTPTTIEGERLCSAIMLNAERPDALICYNDLIAMGFMKEAQTMGFNLPQDISVAGFDNIQYGRYASPALTTVDLKSELMGELAMKKILAAVEGRSEEESAVLAPQLIVRASTKARW
jgi:LacI family transcriptional regulator